MKSPFENHCAHYWKVSHYWTERKPKTHIIGYNSYSRWIMPPKKGNGKSKLKPINGQPSVLSLVSESSITTPSQKKPSKKDRSPPTPPDLVSSSSNPEKRRNISPTMTTEENPLGELTPELLKIDLLIKRNLETHLEPINNKINSLLETAKITERNTVEISNLKRENYLLKTKCQKLEQEQKHIKERLDKMENTQLDNNLIIHGVPEPTAWEYPEMRNAKVVTYLSHTMNGENESEKMNQARNLSMLKTKRIGRFSVDRSRPVSITFSRYEDVEYLLTYKKYLPEGIYLDKEYCEEIEKKRKLLRLIMLCAKTHEDYKKKCRMENDTLIIKGKHYTVNNLHQLPAEINGYQATSKTKEGTTCYFGELNPLSNFHPATFTHDGIQYHSSEQLIQHKKSQLFEDLAAEAAILASNNALDCKIEARNIRNYDHKQWEEMAKSLCYEGIKAKFVQNPWLMKLLLSTNGDTLAEATYDKLWGTGIPLHRRDCTDRNKWHNTGIMGEILMAIREELRPSSVHLTLPDKTLEEEMITQTHNP